MSHNIKNIYFYFIENPDFQENNENREQKAWEFAWRRWRQSKRNEEALATVAKHITTKYHSHSKFGRVNGETFDPIKREKGISYSEKLMRAIPKIEKQNVFSQIPNEEFPNFMPAIGEASKFPPEEVDKEVKYEKGKPGSILGANSANYPKTASQKFREIIKEINE